ncbi:hypothetical protein [Alteribacillus sp. HJP-4]|uniref:hypothetical protein n=1 Tax=Alteribacillus sp. HJP-4 TaxID=2775394 RepID=UPI0035CD0F86
MELIPFENSWPYEKVGTDIYIEECPFCGEHNVLTYLKPAQLKRAEEEIKTALVMPCCNGKMVIVKADGDYFWTTKQLRKRGDH